jgi:hypothetical protein
LQATTDTNARFDSVPLSRASSQILLVFPLSAFFGFLQTTDTEAKDLETDTHRDKDKERRRKQQNSAQDADSKVSTYIQPGQEEVRFAKLDLASESKTQVSSLLSASLMALPPADHSDAFKEKASKLDRKKQYYQVFYRVNVEPLEVSCSGDVTVEEFLELVLQQYAAEGLMPPLVRGASNYELRLLDNDEGSPDMEAPALHRRHKVSRLGLSMMVLVALAPAKGATAPQRSLERSGSIAFRKLAETKDKAFLKVYIDGDSTIMKAPPGSKLVELLPAIHTFIQKKKVFQKTTALDPQKYYFFYYEGNEPLSMHMRVEALQQKELELRLKVPKSIVLQLLHAKEIESIPEFTDETAAVMTTYRVAKTNLRGKEQERIMGVDANFIYNSVVDPLATGPGAKAKNDKRAISTVQEIKLIPGCNNRHFRIVFRERGGVTSREYRGEPRECMEIVNKIQFLISRQQVSAQLMYIQALNDALIYYIFNYVSCLFRVCGVFLCSINISNTALCPPSTAYLRCHKRGADDRSLCLACGA